MSEEVNEEENPVLTLPETVWDEYDGKRVVVQLKLSYCAVTAPGVPVGGLGENGIPQFLQVPMLAGIFRIKRDKAGSLRVTMLINDPDENKKNALVRVDLEPALIAFVTVTPEAQESKIITE